MSNIVKIGKAIKQILTDCDEVNSKVNGQVFALIADDIKTKVNFPFICYQRIGLSVMNEKDNTTYDEYVTVNIYVIDTNYERGLDITDKVIDKMQHFSGNVKGVDIDDIRLEGGSEQFTDDAFIQELQFRIEVCN